MFSQFVSNGQKSEYHLSFFYVLFQHFNSLRNAQNFVSNECVPRERVLGLLSIELCDLFNNFDLPVDTAGHFSQDYG